MPYQLYLSKPDGLALFIKYLTPEAENELRRGMSTKKAPVLRLELLTGKRVLLRADNIIMARQVTVEDYEKMKAAQKEQDDLDKEAAERHRRTIMPAIPGGRRIS